MIKLSKPIILDETLQTLVSVQNQTRTALDNRMYDIPAFSTATMFSNGTYAPPNGYDGYIMITVSVSKKLMSKAITLDGEYTPDFGYTAFDTITVNVPALSTSDINITENGLYYPNDGYAFSKATVYIDDTELKSIVNKTIKSIYNPKIYKVRMGAFKNCGLLSLVSFPNCTSIGESAFANCYNLTDLYLDDISKVPLLLNSNAFNSTPIGGYSTSAGKYGSIYVPSELLSSFKTAANWSYFSDRMVGV